MAGLKDELTDDQSVLVRAVWDAQIKHGRWPIYQFVEADLHRVGIGALATLASFPTVGAPGSGPRYSAVHYEIAGRTTPKPGSLVKLTLAGLRHVPNDLGRTERFLSLVKLLVQERQDAPYSPIHEVSVNITPDMIVRHFRGASRDSWVFLHEAARLEPPTWAGLSNGPDDFDWWHDIGPEILDYADVTDVDDYLNRVTAQLTPRRTVVSSVVMPPRDLVGAIDYLDTVWQLRFKAKLVQVDSLERVAMLALPVETADAFDAGLSAFADVLSHLSVVDQPGSADQHPITKLGAFLPGRLPLADHNRIQAALATLNRIKTVRHGMQHAKAAPAAAEALHELGVGYPIANWSAAWDAIRLAGIGAFDALREEIQISRRATQARGRVAET
jgi:hypothetical protein